VITHGPFPALGGPAERSRHIQRGERIMDEANTSIGKLFESLHERTKELNCLYAIEEILRDPDSTPENVCRAIVKTLPPGWQFPDACKVMIELSGNRYFSADYSASRWTLSADIVVRDKKVGAITVSYTSDIPTQERGPFLKEECQLVKTVAIRLGHFLTCRQLRNLVQGVQSAREELSRVTQHQWRVVLELLRRTEQDLFYRMAQKMLNHLCWTGISAAQQLMGSYPDRIEDEETTLEDPNRPGRRASLALSPETIDAIFNIAAEHVPDQDILACIRKWMQEDKMGFLVQVVNRHLTLPVVADAVRRYQRLGMSLSLAASPARRGVEIALIRRFLSDRLTYINTARDFFHIDDFGGLLPRLIFTVDSHGKLGGKSAGLYLAARILDKAREAGQPLPEIQIPHTWHLTSDVLLYFMHYNNLDDVIEQKYKEINRVRQEHPHVIQMFRRALFPPDILKGLSMALDDFGNHPIIVRSSSLLEDRTDTALAGLYASRILANQGTKRERLTALANAITEIYASTFGPEPISCRAEKGLLDLGEEMGIIIQKVVGRRVGHYYLPAYTGAVTSCNEFRWSAKLERNDGLLRLVPGLGTRLSRHQSDEYPILVAPGKPEIRVNTTVSEIQRYAPKWIDAINLKTNAVETILLADVLEEFGGEYPAINQIVSTSNGDNTLRPLNGRIDFIREHPVVTFDGLIANTPLVGQIDAIRQLLTERWGMPVEFEFASDGEKLYLLQCRAQDTLDAMCAPVIPDDVPKDRIVFTTQRHVPNGRITDITHIVYIDAVGHDLTIRRDNRDHLCRAIGMLNRVLPKRQFILVGPARWGCREGNCRGLPVSYAEISNTAALLEIAQRHGNQSPEVSFGAHFFQDLLQAQIPFLSLYPGDSETIINRQFLAGSQNILCDVLQEFDHLANAVRLIDVPRSTGGLVLELLMNAQLNRAICFLAKPRMATEPLAAPCRDGEQRPDTNWCWRLPIIQQLAAKLDPHRFGVAGFYVVGGDQLGKQAETGKIEVLIHFRGTDEQRELLQLWLEGWSRCLDEMNYQCGGRRCGGMLNVGYISDSNIMNRTGPACSFNPTASLTPLHCGKPLSPAVSKES